MDAVAAYSASQLESPGMLTGFSRDGRQERRHLAARLTFDRQQARDARDRRDEAAARVADLRRDQDALERFEKAVGWRRDEIGRLHEQLDDHWAQMVAFSVGADDPLAFGIDKLRHARATTVARITQLEPSIPPDRGEEWQKARAQLPALVRARHQAEAALADRQERLDAAGRRRWGRHDHEAIDAANNRVGIATQDLEAAVAAERNLRVQLARISSRQQEVNRRSPTASRDARRSRPPSLSSRQRSITSAPSGSAPYLGNPPRNWSTI